MSCVYLYKELPTSFKSPLSWKTGLKGVSLGMALCLLVGSFYGSYNYYTFTLQLHCPVVQVGPSPVELPLTALASFPGSGNTWTRHVVQQATGDHRNPVNIRIQRTGDGPFYFINIQLKPPSGVREVAVNTIQVNDLGLATGGVYCEPHLRLKGFPWECVKNGSVILIKTHHENLSLDRLKYQRIVVLLRNPFDAIRAEFNRRHSKGNNQTGFAPKSFLRLWPKDARNMAAEWKRCLINWMNFKGPIHVVRYENLLKNVTHELQMLFQFLQIPVPLENLQCAILNSEGSYHRKKKAKSMLQFDKNLTKFVQSNIDIVSRTTKLKLDMYTDVQGKTER